MKRNPHFKLALIATVAAGAPMLAAAAPVQVCAPTGNDWPEVNGTICAHQYSSLDQIKAANIKQLAPAWVVHVSAEPITSPNATPGDNSTANTETSPIVVDGVMYLDTPSGGVIALDGATGKVKWKWQPSVAANGYGPTALHRGVSVGEGKVFTTASGNRVVALDQNTGTVLWVVQPTAADGSTLGNISKAHTMYYKGMVYQGTNDSNHNAFFALNAKDGSMAWYFFSAYPHGTSFTDVNGKTFDAGDTWTTKSSPNDTPNNCYLSGGAAPWQHPTIDPNLGLIYVTFGNARSCSGAQDGSGRPGDNLFAASLVALDLKTGADKWHFQSVHHDFWDQDNVLPPQIADVSVDGLTRKVIYYGSKSGHQFVLDRTNGKPVVPVVERPVPYDVNSNASPTQPFPTSGGFMEQCVAYQNLGSDIPGLPNRAVPNWNGFQAEPDPDHPGQLRLVKHEPNYLDAEAPSMQGPDRVGCEFDGAYGSFISLSMTSNNGGADMSVPGYSPSLNLRYIPYSYSPSVHPLSQGGNGLRQIGGYQTGGLSAVDASTNRIVWKKQFPLDASRQNNPLVTASNLLFISQMDGFELGLDAATGQELWRFQMGFPSQSGTITYSINGEQYIAVAAMAGNQPYNQKPNGDVVWVFKLGGKAKYTSGPQSAPVVVSGSQEAPTPTYEPRRPVDNTQATGMPPNTIYMARSNATATATKDSIATASMVPSTLTVPAGTTVTFTNPGDDTFGAPGSGNQKEHCATQFFEGKFNFRLQPGQSAQYKFDREGEYFYNDCTDPRPVGKVVVKLTPVDQPGALQAIPPVLNMKGADGTFSAVQGLATLSMKVPAGLKLDGNVQLQTPLSGALFPAVSATMTADGRTLIATFDKALIDNNLPAGSNVPLTLFANFLDGDQQTKLTSTATVTVLK
jgi:outer membrane protein assembly factor BamB